MAADVRFATETVDAETDAVTALLAGGAVRIYSGTRPTTANDPPPGDCVLLAEVPLTTFGASVAGVASAVVDPAVGLATGVPTWFRAVRMSNLAVFDGNVAAADAAMTIAPLLIQTGGTVSLNSFVYTSPRT